MSRLITALALLALTGCATASNGRPASASRPLSGAERVLCIQDSSAGFGTITVRTEHGLKFNPWPGERVCKVTPVPTRMSVTSIGGGLGGPLRGSIAFGMTGEPCMVWILQGIRDAENRLVPCHWPRR